MSDQTFRCGDHDALVGYLYGECAAADRERIDAHLAVCPACAGEAAALGETRRQLAAWQPPEVALGVRVPAESADAPWTPSPGPWWTQPLPAWAQAAAAVLIFAAGMSAGGFRTPPAEPVASTAAAPGPEVVVPTAIAVSPADLADLERRIRADVGLELAGLSEQIGRVEGRSVAVAARLDDRELHRRMQAVVEESEARQRLDLARTADLVRQSEAQRIADLRRMEQAIGRVEGGTAEAVMQQREAFERFVVYMATAR